MAIKRIINKRKPKPKSKSKVTAKQTKQEEKLKQKQKQIVNVKVNIDQSKRETKGSTPNMGGHTSVINTYPLYQEQPRVPAIIFNNPPNTNIPNTNPLNTNPTTSSANSTQTNHFQSPEEGTRTGFRNIPTYHRSHNPNYNRENIRIEELQPRQNDFHSPSSQTTTGSNIQPNRGSRRQISIRAGGGAVTGNGTSAGTESGDNFSFSDIHQNDEINIQENPLSPVRELVENIENQINNARINNARMLRNPETGYPIENNEQRGQYANLIQSGYTREQIQVFTQICEAHKLTNEEKKKLGKRFKNESIEKIKQDYFKSNR